MRLDYVGYETCIYCCTAVDFYQVDFQPDMFDKMSPEQKATMLASTVHTDYMFFENDRPPIEFVPTDNGVLIIVTYVEGLNVFLFWPCFLLIPL